MQKVAIVLAGILLVIAGVSAVRTIGNESTLEPEPAAPPPPAPTPTDALPRIDGPPPPTVPFPTVDAVSSAMSRAGLTCTDFNILDQDDPTLKSFALCDIGTPDNRYNIYVFRNSNARDGWIGSIAGSGLPWVFGPNWIVIAAGDPNTAERRARLVQQAIGGQIAEVQFQSRRLGPKADHLRGRLRAQVLLS